MMIDYYVRRVKFPNRAAPGVVCPNDDSSYDIYINTLFPESKQIEGIWHELRHLQDGHFETDKPIAEIEAEARGEEDSVPSETEWLYDPYGMPLKPMPSHDPSEKIIPLYSSPNAILEVWKRTGLLDELLKKAK